MGIFVSCAGGGGGINFAGSEVPSGTVDGTNTTYTLAHTATSDSLQLFWNGVRQYPTTDYTISGATITMTYAPASGSYPLADYRY